MFPNRAMMRAASRVDTPSASGGRTPLHHKRYPPLRPLDVYPSAPIETQSLRDEPTGISEAAAGVRDGTRPKGGVASDGNSSTGT